MFSAAFIGIVVIYSFMFGGTWAAPGPQIGDVKCMNGYKYRYSIISYASADWDQIIGEKGGGIPCDK